MPARRGRAGAGALLGSAWRLVLVTQGAFDLLDTAAWHVCQSPDLAEAGSLMCSEEAGFPEGT